MVHGGLQLRDLKLLICVSLLMNIVAGRGNF
jgi:hypothetical protein